VPGAPRDNVQVLLTEAGSGRPVLTSSRNGVGRVFFLGTHETWRWRYQVGEGEQDRFWRQLVRHAAGEPYAVRSGGLALDVEEAAAPPGKPVLVRARVMPPTSGEPATRAPASAYHLELTRDGKPVGSEPLTEPVPESGRLEATLKGLPEGDYEVRLVGPGAEGGLKTALHVQASLEEELKNVAGDVPALRRIAEATGGGEVLRLDQVGQLPARLAAAGGKTPEVSEWSLWDSPHLFVFVLACLGAEWGLRKRFGLA
jgi:hypothetical protein